MMNTEFLDECKLEMDSVIEHTQRELALLRTGRATPAILDPVQVDAYGTPTPLRQLANISVPEARLIVIQPWDKSMLGEIEKAIQKADIGITPNNDGKLIRLPIPPLTEERRRELVKIAKKTGEEGKVSLRTYRRESMESLKKAIKDGTLPEDEAKQLEAEVQKLTDDYGKKIDSILEDKEKEIMNV